MGPPRCHRRRDHCFRLLVVVMSVTNVGAGLAGSANAAERRVRPGDLQRIRPGLVIDAGAILGYQETMSYTAQVEAAYMFPYFPLGVHCGVAYTFDAKAVMVPVKVSFTILRLLSESWVPYIYAGNAIVALLPRKLPSGTVFGAFGAFNPMVGIASKFYLTDRLGITVDLAGIYASMQPDISGSVPPGVDSTARFSTFTLQPSIGATYRF